MRESKSEILSDVSGDVLESRIVANNTVEYEIGSERRIRLHHTDIITYRTNGDVVLNSGGWQTVTTKDRFNQFGFRIYLEKGQWFIDDGIPFHDGMVLPKGNPPKITKADGKRLAASERLAKEIMKFCRLVNSVEKLPEPNGGDCWLCMADNADSDHLKSHIAEGYLHGTLLINAMCAAGYDENQIGLHYRMDLRDTFKRTLRRYLRRNLGLPT